MSKRQILCVLGVLVAVFLFLGLPTFWDKILAVLMGLSIIAIAYNLAPDQKKSAVPGDKETFIENQP